MLFQLESQNIRAGVASMGLLRRTRSEDVIFLIPVDNPDEKSSKGKIGMLYCDTGGKVYTVPIDKSVYKIITDDIRKMEDTERYYATVGLEISPGNYVPKVIEISSEESLALSHTLEHALRNGMIPDVLIKYIKSIVKKGQHIDGGTGKHDKQIKDTPHEPIRILNRLPYYLEKDMEFSMPIYKAEHRYPLIVLKYISSAESGGGNGQELLIIDSDGDMAIIKVPFKLLNKAEKRLKDWAAENNRHACLTINRERKGYSINYIVISAAQKRALDIMARNYEDSGSGKHPVSTAAQRVISIAREAVA